MFCGNLNVGFVSASRPPSSSGVSLTSIEPTLSSSWVNRLAPMMVEDTPGCACTQDSATRATELSWAPVTRLLQQEQEGPVTDLADNKRIVVDYYTTGFAGNPEKAAADYLVPEYIQHNPTVADGPDEFIQGLHLRRDRYPNMRLDIKRVIAEA